MDGGEIESEVSIDLVKIVRPRQNTAAPNDDGNSRFGEHRGGIQSEGLELLAHIEIITNMKS